MQPDQPNQPPPTNPNIPDYLGMEPIKEPKPPISKRKLLLAVGIPLFIVGLTLLGLVSWSWLDGEPERRFYASIGTMLSQKHISQSYTLSLNDKTMRTTSTQTDYAESGKPKQHMKQSRTIVDNENTPHMFSTEVITIDEQTITAKFEDVPDFDKAAGTLSPGQWYELSADTPQAVMSVLNVNIATEPKAALFGDIVVGAFSDNQRQELMDFIKKGRIYDVVELRTEKLGDQDMSVFTVDYDTNGIAELNKKVATILGISSVPVQYRAMAEAKPVIKRVKIWVDSTNRITQTQYRELEDDDKSTILATTQFTYPETLKIERPADVKDL